LLFKTIWLNLFQINLILKKLILISTLVLFGLNLLAETPAPKPDTVIDVYLDGNKKEKSAAISDIIVVDVAHLNGLLTAQNSIKQVRLFINSIEIEGSTPVGWYLHGDSAELKFLLQRNPVNNKTWNMLLGYPQLGSQFFNLPLSISIGLTGQSSQATKVSSFRFLRIEQSWFWICIAVLLVYLGVLFNYAKTTPMLRDTPADLTPLGIPGLAAGNAPYSLGKVQMAFWFSIVLASYIFIWLITDNYELINSGILVLIGIGAGTGLGAISINNNKTDKTIKQVQDLQAQQADLRQATDLLKAALPAAGIEAKIGYNNFLDCQLTSNINKLIDGLKMGKDNFINDILTDENGVSFHRLQMVVFTTVLGFVFLYTAWATLTMPDFSATLLTMQGITAGTYLGFKIPEKQS
jgi:outer membrane murein-binding lipoprotein Lpp